MNFQENNYLKLSKYIGLALSFIFLFQYFNIGIKLVPEVVTPYVIGLSITFLVIHLYLKVKKEKENKTFRIKKYAPLILGLTASAILTIIAFMKVR